MTVLRVEVRQFNKQTFLDSVDAHDRPFYEKVRAKEQMSWKMYDKVRTKEKYTANKRL